MRISQFSKTLFISYVFPAHIIFTTAITAILLPYVLYKNGITFGDFVVFKAAAHLADINPVLAYDTEHLGHTIRTLSLDDREVGLLYWRYPPHFFFAIEWLKWFPYYIGAILWTIFNLTVFTFGIYQLTNKDCSTLLILISPSVVGVLTMGQNGFFIAGLLALFIRCSGSHPILAGLIISIISFKPHLAIALPFYLASRNEWKPIIWGLTFTSVLIFVSICIYGNATWVTFLNSFLASFYENTEWSTDMTTGSTAFYILLQQVLGTYWVKYGYGLVVVGTVIILFLAARKTNSVLNAALLLAGATAILSPKFMAYDAVFWLLPMVLLIQRGIRQKFGTLDAVIVALIWWILPFIGISHDAIGFHVWALFGFGMFCYGATCVFRGKFETNEQEKRIDLQNFCS